MAVKVETAVILLARPKLFSSSSVVVSELVSFSYVYRMRQVQKSERSNCLHVQSGSRK
jgi:hypothetical protein